MRSRLKDSSLLRCSIHGGMLALAACSATPGSGDTQLGATNRAGASASGSPAQQVAPAGGRTGGATAAGTGTGTPPPVGAVAGSSGGGSTVPVATGGMTGPGPVPPIGEFAASPHWVSYGNGPKNQFYNPTETKISVATAPMLKVTWMITPGEVTGAPAIVGDKLYVASGSGLFGMNAADGSTLWTLPINSTSAPFYDEASKMLFVSARDGTIHGVDAEKGEQKWMEMISTQARTIGWSSPIVSGDLVVVGQGSLDRDTYKGGVAAFDKLTGKKLWEHVHAKTNGASIWSGPGADADGVIYATSGNNYGEVDERSDSIFALMPGAGSATLLWNFQAMMGDGWSFTNTNGGPDHDFGANPIILDQGGMKLVAAGQKSGEFHLLERTKGTVIATQKLCQTTSLANGGILNNGAYDGMNNYFIAAANEGMAPGQTVAMEADPSMKLKVVWMKKNTGLVWGQISTANGVCFVPDSTTMRVLDCKTGTELNSFMTPGTIGSAAAISEGRVVFGSGFSYGGVTASRTLVALGL